MSMLNISTIKEILTNKRLRQDVKSLKAAKKCYIIYAWELIEDFQLNSFMHQPKTLKEIINFSKIKDEKFIETILDLLVGSKNLKFENNKYSLLKKPNYSIQTELKHLEEHCPGSTEWTHWLRKKSKETLITGKKIHSSSFDEAKGILLWEKLMKESPYSLRQISIHQIANKLKNNNEIIDIGCGGGIGLEEILLTSNEPFNLWGLEVSKNYIDKAKKRIKKIESELSEQKLKNTKNTKFIIKDLTKGPLNKKFDAIFISLVVNHISKADQQKFFKNLKKMMTVNSILVTFQFLNNSKFERSPMWVMHNIPSHKEFPYKEEYIQMLKQIFPIVKTKFGGTIITCKLKK